MNRGKTPQELPPDGFPGLLAPTALNPDDDKRSRIRINTMFEEAADVKEEPEEIPSDEFPAPGVSGGPKKDTELRHVSPAPAPWRRNEEYKEEEGTEELQRELPDDVTAIGDTRSYVYSGVGTRSGEHSCSTRSVNISTSRSPADRPLQTGREDIHLVDARRVDEDDGVEDHHPLPSAIAEILPHSTSERRRRVWLGLGTLLLLAFATGVAILAVNLSRQPSSPSSPPLLLFGREWDPGNTTRMELLRVNLTGTIPPELGLMTRLIHLSLGFNSLYGSIPITIGLLTGLTYLDLDHNLMDGSIPYTIEYLTELRGLDLAFNYLIGPIPPTIGLLTKLDYLDLRNNSLTGLIPTGIGSLDQLVRLHLDRNHLSGPVPTAEFLTNHSNLQVLHLYENQLSGSIAPSFCATTIFDIRIDCGEIACNCCRNSSNYGC